MSYGQCFARLEMRSMDAAHHHIIVTNVTHIKIKLAFVIISFALALTMAPQSLSRGFSRIFPFYFHAFPAENDAQSSAKLFGEQSWHRVTAVKRELNASPLPVRRLFLCFNLYLHILFGFS